MAARKNRIGPLGQAWKDKIQTTVLVKRLQDHGLGTLDLKKTQIDAINILLRKTAPDLSTVAHTGDSGGPITITWSEK